jgi:hypothetical protein
MTLKSIKMKTKSHAFLMLNIVAVLFSAIVLNSCLKDSKSNVPELGTTVVSGVSSSQAVGSGKVLNIGNSYLIYYGICWGTTQNPTIENSYVADSAKNNSVFLFNLTDMTGNTQYYARSFATNSFGIGYGAEVSFNTLAPTLPVIKTDTITNIYSTTALSGGIVSDQGGAPVTARGICWNTTTDPTIADSKTTNGTGLGQFTGTMTALTPSTTYSVRAYATNSVGTVYGKSRSFSTSASGK